MNEVNKLAYVLFAFFLGGLGVHKFYAGHVLLGLLYLLFSWTFIPSLLGMFAAFYALITPSRNGNIYR